MANERRLIDMDEAIKQLRDYADRKRINGHNETSNGILKAVSYIRKHMTRVDAVEVVRCGECEHYYSYGKTSLYVDGKNMKAGWCQRRIKYDEEFRMLPCDFCSYGKRRDETDGE